MDLFLFLGILVMAAGARGWYLTTYAADNPALQVQEPQDELKALVENLKQDRAFRCQPPYAVEAEPTAYVAPGYPALLAAIGQLPLGSSSIEGTARWIQCGLGALTA